MQTQFPKSLKTHLDAAQLENILRSCVHCGFCNATCPTYRLLGDERDGPRGRIYLMKSFWETGQASYTTQKHLDRCLTCLHCTTTCPSGVDYAHLLEITRPALEKKLSRSWWQSFIRWSLVQTLPYPRRLLWLLWAAKPFLWLLPKGLRKKVPRLVQLKKSNLLTRNRLQPEMTKKYFLSAGCVQSLTTPETNLAAQKILRQLNIASEVRPGCCGAVAAHLGAEAQALQQMRQNIDAWYPRLISGEISGIISTASGCGVTLKDYGHWLRHDENYAPKAKFISEKVFDIVEILEKAEMSRLPLTPGQKIAFHAPCTLQHGQKLSGRVEKLLTKLGFVLTFVEEASQCCGSAGTYSLLEPKLSQMLKEKKLTALLKEQPERILTANVGCQLHLATDSPQKVEHWLIALAEQLPEDIKDRVN